MIDKDGRLRKYNGSEKNIILPKGITAIGRSAFNECVDLHSVVIPEGVRIIESCAFSNCKRLKSVTIPESVTAIESLAFNE